MENTYELTVILKPETKKEAVDAFLAKIKKIIEEKKGKIKKQEKPEEKTLAYEIDKFNKGIYVFLTFTSQNQTGRQLQSLFKIEEDLLRFLLIKKS